MTKKAALWIGLAVAAVLIVVVAIWARQYYEGRYVGSDYYTMIPLDYDMAPEMMHDMHGGEVGLGKRFTLTAYNEQGEAKTIMFNVYGESSTDFPQPGTFFRVSANQEGLSISQRVIQEGEVPQLALNMIKGN